MEKGLFTVLVWLGTLSWGMAQSQYRLALTNGTYSDAKDTLCLDLVLSFDAAGPLGSANLVFSYDVNALTDPFLHSQAGVDQTLYYPVVLTDFEPGKGSFNIELISDSVGGMLVPGSNDSLLLGSVCFAVANATGDHKIDWYEENVRGTVIYRGDERIRLSSGELIGWEPPAPPPPEPVEGSGVIGFVTKDANNPPAGDITVIQYLESMGHTVELLGETTSTTADADGKDLIYISSTILSGRVGSRFRDVTVPVVVCESHLQDDMKMSGSGFNSQGGMTTIDVLAPDHAIMAGLTDNPLTVYATADRAAYGNPSNDATVIAMWGGRTDRRVIYAYEAGANMVGMAAPARRVAFFFHDKGLMNATEDAKVLLTNAVCWAMGGCQAPTNVAVGDPYGGTPWPIPGMVQAEDFDEGGQGIGYQDNNAHNSGGKYRTEGVDIQNTSDDGGGFNVGWISQGEWLAYTVDVQEAGDYQFAFRVAARSKEGRFHLAIDSVNVTGPMSFPPTGGWQTWTTVHAGPVTLTPGLHLMQMHMESGGFNVNYIEATKVEAGMAPPQTEVITLEPIHDAFLQNNRRFNQSILRVENASSRKRVTYFRFDLSQIDGDITDASLELTCASDPGNGPITVEMGNGSTWTETSLTPTNAPTAVQSLATLTGNYGTNQPYTWTLGALAPTGNDLNLILRQTSGNDVAFASKEYGNAARRPKLVLTVERNAPAGQPDVSWVEVEGIPRLNEVQINWWVDHEQEISLYELQRSIDGVAYQQIDMITSVGNTNSPRMYTIYDPAPLAQHKYYRIRAVGPNGYQSFSEVINLDDQSVVLNFNVYPTPLEADQTLNIDLEVQQPGPITVGVFNYQGAQMLTEPQTMTQTSETLSLDINSLQPGLYILSILGNGWVKSQRFEVQ